MESNPRGNSCSPFFLTLFCLTALFFTPNVVLAENSQLVPVAPAQQLLQRMVDANRQLNYKGRFTYEYGGVLRTMEVEHHLHDGMVMERLVHLSGPYQEVMHSQDRPGCQHYGEMMLRGLPSEISRNSYNLLTDNYELLIRGQQRVAGRVVDLLQVMPKDKYRYGYSLGLDQETGLLLQSLLIDPNKKVLERFQFVQLDLEGEDDPGEIEPSAVGHYQVSGDAEPCLSEEDKATVMQKWRVDWLPGGFALTDYQTMPERKSEVLVYTDGLSVFSLFIEPAGGPALPEIRAQRGATVAFLVHQQEGEESYQVCVVGEVPVETAQRVAMATHRRSGVAQ